MPFTPDAELPDLSRLKAQLLTSGVQQTNNALWQVIDQLITALMGVTDSVNSGTGSGTGDGDETFITVDNELTTLPNSRIAVGGDDITLDTSTPGQIIINAYGGPSTGYWTLLSDGDLIAPSLVFADGEAIAMFIPL